MAISNAHHERRNKSKSVIFEYMLHIGSSQITLRSMAHNTLDNKSTFVQVMPSGSKPLPEPKLIKIFDTILRHYSTECYHIVFWRESNVAAIHDDVIKWKLFGVTGPL